MTRLLAAERHIQTFALSVSLALMIWAFNTLSNHSTIIARIDERTITTDTQVAIIISDQKIQRVYEMRILSLENRVKYLEAVPDGED